MELEAGRGGWSPQSFSLPPPLGEDSRAKARPEGGERGDSCCPCRGLEGSLGGTACPMEDTTRVRGTGSLSAEAPSEYWGGGGGGGGGGGRGGLLQ